MRRVLIAKRPGFDQASDALTHTLSHQLNIPAKVILITGYDVEGLSETLWSQAVTRIFTEPMVDTVIETLPGILSIAREPLPGQYDQRADAAQQCCMLLDADHVIVKTFEVACFDRPLSEAQRQRFIRYWINPIELCLKDLDLPTTVIDLPVHEGTLNGFTTMQESEALAFLMQEKAAMSLDDLRLIQAHFATIEHRDPTRLEFKILDTYWSDHCRHTTFQSELTDLVIEEGPLQKTLTHWLNHVHHTRTSLNRSTKPLTLMELATLCAKAIDDPRVEHSQEVNACSVRITVDTPHGPQAWLHQFKNETHNHPTEIEPFGGASTCIGGAIRDPLSGRAPVFQALRITGCGNVRESIEATLPGKLPQRVIATRAAHGYSAYGNQIGVATTHVHEYYHPRYVAKHLELGAVVGAAPQAHVRRETPQAGDVILMVGGRTGRDGIGGATGSSQAHTASSLISSASEVQKGNAPEERKLQRLFGNPHAAQLIKRSNDFGAGGISVAIGELAEGLRIDLDAVNTKTSGLSATELAISESQERMAVVVEAHDVETFMRLADQENLECAIVATVTDTTRLIMTHHGHVVADLDRALIDTNGVRQRVIATLSGCPNPLPQSHDWTIESLLAHLGDLNVSVPKGLIERFDASIGATTVLAPLGGHHQLSPTQASVQRIPLASGTSSTTSVVSAGFIPSLSESHLFISAQAALLQALAKTIAVGGSISNVFFSLQEYFPRLRQDPNKWGHVVSALLGAYSVQSVFERPAIGGKDSMSGSSENLDVLETLIAFAFGITDDQRIRPQHLTQPGVPLYLVKAPRLADGSFDLPAIKTAFETLETWMAQGDVLAARVVEDSVIATIARMTFSDHLGAHVMVEDPLALEPCALMVATHRQDVPKSWIPIGHSATTLSVNGILIPLNEAITAFAHGMDFLYPQAPRISGPDPRIPETEAPTSIYPYPAPSIVRVVIPVFPGTNCEDDTSRAVQCAGGLPIQVLLRNQSAKALSDSLRALCAAIDVAHILILPGGFSAGDEPDGSAKFIVNVLRNTEVRRSVEGLLKRQGLILGICNGFQALIKTGLLPFGEYRELTDTDATLTHNTVGRHIATMAKVKVTSNASPWLDGLSPGTILHVPLSHGEGRLRVRDEQIKTWITQGQVAFQYCNDHGEASLDPQFNPNGSDYAIEGLISPCGRILGKMGHTERLYPNLMINLEPISNFPLFHNGIRYIKAKEAPWKNAC
jgi:phosphoribosylformylglycinamidine synthase